VRAAAVAAVAVALAAVPAATASASPFAWRGVIEGAYGPAWDHGARMRVLDWMRAHGFNAYVHAPKYDLWQRTLWRDPYPADQQADFDREIAEANRVGVQWIPNLSPALPEIPTPQPPSSAPSAPLCFSCPADLQAALDKLEPFRRAGARAFMISFDDVVKALVYPQDLAAYGPGDEGFGRACGDFLSRLYAALRARSPDAQLLTVGADYSGTSDTAYLRGFRVALRPGVEVMWTGDTIPSHEFAPADARAYGNLIGRRPLVWDNWTDDDTAGNATPAGTARIFLGPYVRRPDVAGAVGGFFLNPMNEADLNLLPLATAGDWMRDPGAYDPRRSWLRAVAELAPNARDALRAFAEASYSTKLDLREAPRFVHLSNVMLGLYRTGGDWPRVERPLAAELALAENADRALAAIPDRAFFDQAGPFLAAAREAAGAGRLGAELLAAERPSLSVTRSGGRAAPPDPGRASALRGTYRDGSGAMRRNPRFVYGWKTGEAFDVPPYPAPPNVMVVFYDAVDALDGDWQNHASDAAASVRVKLAGRELPLRSDGSFSLPPSACGKVVEAVDGAGGRTDSRVPPCVAHKRHRGHHRHRAGFGPHSGP
jgi:hyaluronoglucosaminidase